MEERHGCLNAQDETKGDAKQSKQRGRQRTNLLLLLHRQLMYIIETRVLILEGDAFRVLMLLQKVHVPLHLLKVGWILHWVEFVLTSKSV